MARPCLQLWKLEGTVRPVRTADLRRVRIRWIPLIVVIACLSLSGCSGSSGVHELEHDAETDTIAGPRPTAPPATDYDGPGLSAEATRLLSGLRDLDSERSLCAILTSTTVTEVLGGEVEISGLATTPSGIAQLLVAIDRFFGHVVEVSPPDLAPSTTVIQNTWRQVAEIAGDAGDRDRRIEAILAAPDVQLAVENVGTWVQGNCVGALGGQLDLGGLLGI